MINSVFIIRAVAAQRNSFIGNMSQKIRNNRRVVTVVGSHFRGDDLLGFDVHRSMKFTPSSAFAPSVFVNLQTDTVDHNVKRTALTAYFERNIQCFGTFAKGRIFGNTCFLNFEERKHILPQTFGASIGKAEDFANDW